MFVGDAAAHRKGKVVRGWFNRPTNDIDQSLRTIADLEFSIACFGHSDPLRDGAAAAFEKGAAAI